MTTRPVTITPRKALQRTIEHREIFHDEMMQPEDFGLTMASSRNLAVTNAEESKSMLLDALQDRQVIPRDTVCMNAGAALYVAGRAASIASGIELARATIASGAARAKMDTFVAATRRLADHRY